MFNQPRYVNMYKTRCEFKPFEEKKEIIDADEDYEPLQLNERTEPRKYLAGEKLLKKMNKMSISKKMTHKEKKVEFDKCDIEKLISDINNLFDDCSL